MEKKSETSFPTLQESRSGVVYQSRRKVSGTGEGDTFFWFWIGDHDEYERLILFPVENETILSPTLRVAPQLDRKKTVS